MVIFKLAGFTARLAFASAAVGFVFHVSSVQAFADAELANADGDKIRTHIEFLADDLLEGRLTGSRGHLLAAQYVAAQFKLLGFAPGGDSDTYFQDVPMMSSQVNVDASGGSLIKDGVETQLVIGQTMGMPGGYGDAVEDASAEVVFVGYGVADDALNYNDYAGVDVEGKIVAAFMGVPPALPPDQGAYYMPPWQKMAVARAQGARGLILLWNPAFEQFFPWASAMQFMGSTQMNWTGPDGQAVPGYQDLSPLAVIEMNEARKLFMGAEQSFDEAFENAQKGETTAFPLNAEVRLHRESMQDHIVSPNVVGILEGRDPELKNEYVVFSAHLDHLGTTDGDGGHGEAVDGEDKVFNGANDNAAGVAIMLEVARLFADLPEGPARSVIFLATTGEEQNLIGADYFASNPTVSVQNIVANVNLDMPILTFPFTDVVVIGADHSSLERQAIDATAALGVTNTPDPAPEQALFVRSDQLGFIKQGIPAVFLRTGIISDDPDIDGATARGEFYQKYYHQLGDDLAAPFYKSSAEMFTNVNFLIGLSVANAKERPTWNEGDYFGEAFGGAR